jgi:DDE superfamily endonuclease
MELITSFRQLLEPFQCVFTDPSFQNFVCLMTGWVLSHRRRFVTDLIWSSGCTRRGHHSGYHRFFSDAAWKLDAMSQVLAHLIVYVLVPTGIIELALDDTLCRKRGLTIYGTGMHYDPLISSRAKRLTSWGHDWVVVTLIIRNLPWAPTKVWSLPLMFCLYRNRQGVTKGKKKPRRGGKKAKRAPQPANHRTRPELAVELLSQLAGWFPQRQFMVSGDSAYGGHSVLSKLPPNVELISHVSPKGAMYEPAPPVVEGQKGRHRKKGKRLSGMPAWAADQSQPWQTLEFDEFGLHATLQVKTRQALYYTAGGQRLLTIVLVRDVEGKRPDQMFYCTRLTWTAREILSCYARRWSIEVAFENGKQLLGFEDPANRKPKAVERTAPMALLLYSLVIVWFHQTGHRYVKFPDRPWYPQKKGPSFADMLTTLRRQSWTEQFSPVLSKSGLAKKYLTQVIEFLSLAG